MRGSEAGLVARTQPRGESRQGGRAVQRVVLVVALCVASAIAQAALLEGSVPADDMAGISSEIPLATSFQQQVEPRLQPPQVELVAFAVRLRQTLDAAQVRSRSLCCQSQK